MYTRSLYKHKGLYSNRKVEYARVMFDTFFQQGVLKGKHNGIKGAITKCVPIFNLGYFDSIMF